MIRVSAWSFYGAGPLPGLWGLFLLCVHLADPLSHDSSSKGTNPIHEGSSLMT